MIAFERAVPVMPCGDLEESAAFYRRLGFAAARPNATYIILERGGAEIHLTMSADSVPEKSGCYVVVRGIDDLLKELIATGIRVEPPITQPWGLREMYVRDPSGNFIRFAEGEGNM